MPSNSCSSEPTRHQICQELRRSLWVAMVFSAFVSGLGWLCAHKLLMVGGLTYACGHCFSFHLARRTVTAITQLHFDRRRYETPHPNLDLPMGIEQRQAG